MNGRGRRKPSDVDRIVTELHSIHIELKRLREAILSTPTPGGDDQGKAEALAARLGKKTDELSASTSTEPE